MRTSEPVSYAEQYLSLSTPPAIGHRDVKRLALEGGGGKGNAYLGALYALEQLNVLKPGRLDVVAGSSAGAITAMALSLGMRPHEIFTFMATTKFAEFFDRESAAVPTVGAPYERPGTAAARAKRQAAELAWTADVMLVSTLGRIASGLRIASDQVRYQVVSGLLSGLFAVEDIAYSLTELGMIAPGGRPARSIPAPPQEPSLKRKVIEQVIGDLGPYLTSLSLDMGIFSGEAAREKIADLISERIGILDRVSVDGRTFTFEDLDRFCARHDLPRLRVSGSEMCAFKTVIFSGEATRRFPVADAVRISMGLPIVYKPYTIRKSGEGFPPCGVYVDGGVFANLPFRALSEEEIPAALGLRLEIDEPEPINGILGYFSRLFQASLFAGESDVIGERSDRSIRLDTTPLDLFDFAVPEATLAKVTIRSHLTTLLYFGQGSSFAPVDLRTGAPLDPKAARAAKDDALTDLSSSIALRKQRAACVFASE